LKIFAETVIVTVLRCILYSLKPNQKSENNWENVHFFILNAGERRAGGERHWGDELHAGGCGKGQ
jgi:hypothetical protein